MNSTEKSIKIQKPEIDPDTNAQQELSDDARPDYAEIARRAYEIYIERGGGQGHDLDDWLQAECELQRERLSSEQEIRLRVEGHEENLQFGRSL